MTSFRSPPPQARRRARLRSAASPTGSGAGTCCGNPCAESRGPEPNPGDSSGGCVGQPKGEHSSRTLQRPSASTGAGVLLQTSATPQRFDAASSVDLSSMFGELKQELEHGGTSADEDPETHYNLGVAFREMGLLDEAIGELQKVCQFVDRGHTFPNIMQAYTWLATVLP